MTKEILRTLEELVNTPSPTGWTRLAEQYS